MNEVNFIGSASKAFASLGELISSKSGNGTEVSVLNKDVVKTSSQISHEALKEAVTHINEYVQSIQRDLQFSVDEDLGGTIVKVVDRQSGDLIRQIPNEVVVDIAKNLQQLGEINLLTTVS